MKSTNDFLVEGEWGFYRRGEGMRTTDFAGGYLVFEFGAADFSGNVVTWHFT
ncbi:hypothetical protein [Herbaspirillum sp. alder98]|uniref:hypothetical protein n=1 Tax=Herbaspirillum sp. alder98 TaxID=2913096 RepID=UPI001CD9033D|nr:hypothetical protein [Herbaspirillum sp. alder98]